MDPQDSTPEINEGGQPSPQESAEQQTPSQPSTQQDTPVENDTPSQSQDAEDTQTPNDGSGEDEELAQWAKSQGYSLETENERKLAKRLRDTQKAFHERGNNNQQFNDIQQQLGDEDEDPLESELRQLKAQNARRDFWDSHNDDRTLEGAMIQEVQDMLKKGNKAGAAYYSSPEGWHDLLAIVKARNGDQIKDESFEAGRKTERANLAKAQQAAGPNAAATSSAPAPQVTDDAAIAKMSLAEYTEWRKTHNPFKV